jgi:hypothetical protein
MSVATISAPGTASSTARVTMPVPAAVSRILSGRTTATRFATCSAYGANRSGPMYRSYNAGVECLKTSVSAIDRGSHHRRSLVNSARHTGSDCASGGPTTPKRLGLCCQPRERLNTALVCGSLRIPDEELFERRCRRQHRCEEACGLRAKVLPRRRRSVPVKRTIRVARGRSLHRP